MIQTGVSCQGKKDQVGSRRSLMALRWGLLALLVILGCRYLLTHLSDFQRAVGHLSGPVLLLMLLISLVNIVIAGLRWYLVVRQFGTRIALAACLRLFSVGRLLGLLMPQSGTIYRAIALKKECGMSFPLYAKMMMTFVWLTLVVSLIIGEGILVTTRTSLILLGVDGRILLGCLLTGATTLPFILARRARCYVERADVFGASARSVLYVVDGICLLTKSGRLLFVFVLLSFVSFLLLYLQLALAYHNIGIAAESGMLALVAALLKLGAIVLITPGNAGVLELLSGYITEAAQYSMAAGILILLEIRVVSSLAVLGAALLTGWRDIVSFLPITRRSPRSIDKKENHKNTGSNDATE